MFGSNSFPCIEIEKQLLAPVHSVTMTRLNFRNEFKLLSKIRNLNTFKVSAVSNIIDNTLRKSIHV